MANIFKDEDGTLRYVPDAARPASFLDAFREYMELEMMKIFATDWYLLNGLPLPSHLKTPDQPEEQP